VSDTLHRFLFEDAPVRGQVVQLGGVLADAVRRQSQPPPVAQLLGEMMAATALLASLLREGDLTLQARGRGPVRSAMAECHGGNGLRAIARLATDAGDGGHAWPVAAAAGEPPPVAALDALLGDGDLALTIRPPVGEMQQSIVARSGYSLAGCLEHYFATSEQLPTQLWLTAGVDREGRPAAAGLLLQRLPLHPQATDTQAALAEQAWRAITAAASAVTATTLRTLPPEGLLRELVRACRRAPAARPAARVPLPLRAHAVRARTAPARPRRGRGRAGAGRRRHDDVRVLRPPLRLRRHGGACAVRARVMPGPRLASRPPRRHAAAASAAARGSRCDDARPAQPATQAARTAGRRPRARHPARAPSGLSSPRHGSGRGYRYNSRPPGVPPNAITRSTTPPWQSASSHRCSP
jgi:molecular chaperone Hsp33